MESILLSNLHETVSKVAYPLTEEALRSRVEQANAKNYEFFRYFADGLHLKGGYNAIFGSRSGGAYTSVCPKENHDNQERYDPSAGMVIIDGSPYYGAETSAVGHFSQTTFQNHIVMEKALCGS